MAKFLGMARNLIFKGPNIIEIYKFAFIIHSNIIVNLQVHLS